MNEGGREGRGGFKGEEGGEGRGDGGGDEVEWWRRRRRRRRFRRMNRHQNIEKRFSEIRETT